MFHYLSPRTVFLVTSLIITDPDLFWFSKPSYLVGLETSTSLEPDRGTLLLFWDQFVTQRVTEIRVGTVLTANVGLLRNDTPNRTRTILQVVVSGGGG